ncbi:hypothetical protein JXB12_04925 [candidate division KSB1 bacterium]|nr:hypothetical protein [candidate division KSB1 bacterium]
MKRQINLIITLTMLLSASLAIVSIFGAFVPETYEREVDSMAAQGVGQDMVNLFLVVPILVISSLYLLKQSKIAAFIHAGTVFYVLYSFVIYSLGIHFNSLFLLYCLTLGLSLYTFILSMYQLTGMNVMNWHDAKIPEKYMGTYLIFIAALFYALWLQEIIPAHLNNMIPKSVSDYNLLVNPVHVMDLSIVLPALVITAILLFKKQRLGYILTPILFVFIVILTIALAGMVLMLKVRGVSEDISLIFIFTILAIISMSFLINFLNKIRKRY